VNENLFVIQFLAKFSAIFFNSSRLVVINFLESLFIVFKVLKNHQCTISPINFWNSGIAVHKTTLTTNKRPDITCLL